MLTTPETDPLATIRGEFDRHRATHRRGRFPERLWQQAVELAREHGIERVACGLDLDEYGLRRRMTAISRCASADSAPPFQPTFVDALISSITEPAPASSQASSPSGSAEIECSRGRLRIEWNGIAPDLGAIARAFTEEAR